MQLEGDACREAIAFLVHASDEASVFHKMKETFKHRQDLVHNPQRTTNILTVFPRFLDVKGLVSLQQTLFKLFFYTNLEHSLYILNLYLQVNQDFVLMFNAETSSKLLEKWDTSFKPKVIAEAQHLTSSTELCFLLKAAEETEEDTETSKNTYNIHVTQDLRIDIYILNYLLHFLPDWDSDMASLLLLLYLLPPAAGRKRIRSSPTDAVDKLVHFHKVP